jgi:hypothetical protein
MRAELKAGHEPAARAMYDVVCKIGAGISIAARREVHNELHGQVFSALNDVVGSIRLAAKGEQGYERIFV